MPQRAFPTSNLPIIRMPTNQQGVPCRPTIAEAIELMRSGRLTSAELTENCLTRIRDLDRSIHAWAKVDEAGARAAATDCDRRARAGEEIGPLHGIPIGIKDIVDIAGMATVAGAPWRAGHIAERDAAVVAKLREAGAVILGKTHTTQFAFIDSAGTHNPWNYARSPGGSSSGSAAGVAAEMCWGAVASQTGGSTIRPSAFCGIVGVKPTFGSIDTTGVVPLCRELDTIGLMTACVDDARAMLGVMQGISLAAPSPDTPPPKLGFVEEYFMAWAEEPIQAAVEAAVEAFSAAGAAIHSVSLPASFAEAQAMQLRVMAHGAAETHRDEFARREANYGPQIAGLIRDGMALSAEDLSAAFAHQKRFTADIKTLFADGAAAGYILIMPATVAPAPEGLTAMGDPRFNSAWTYCGTPVVTIPCRLSESGLPIGLQLVGPHNSEKELLAAAAWCEQILRPLGHPLFAAG